MCCVCVGCDRVQKIPPVKVPPTQTHTALRFGACLGLNGMAVSYNLTYQNANNQPSAADWILPSDTSWVYSMEQRTMCIAENRSLCYPFYKPTFEYKLSPTANLAFQLFHDVRNVRKCHRIRGSNWPDDFTVQVWDMLPTCC